MVGDDQRFNFDQVFTDAASQEEIFEMVAKKPIKDVLRGFNATQFCYGQTGSGKTYTMYGKDIGTNDQIGIIPRAIQYIFEVLALFSKLMNFLKTKLNLKSTIL